MALYAFDGTGNEDQADDAMDSNVTDFFNGYDDPDKNADPEAKTGSLYMKGIGTRARKKLGKGASKAFGLGGHRRVRQAMDRLENNIEAGDEVIDIVGFSRGAALSISFANEVATKLDGRSVRFIGVWDIVGEFGLPGKHVNAGHNLNLPPNAMRCYHAMALDEMRLLFPLTRLRGTGGHEEGRLVEAWFRGVHSDVGGGNGNRGMNWIALNWMFENAKREGLPIRPDAVARNLQDQGLPQQIGDSRIEIGPPRKILPDDLLHASVKLAPGIAGRPHNNPPFTLARIDDSGGTVAG